MIRINLIEGAQKRTQTATASTETVVTASAPPMTKIGMGVAFLAVLLLIGHYLYLQRQASELETKIGAAQAESERLADVKKQFDSNSAQKQELTRRISIIEQLKSNQTGPSDFLTVTARTVQGAKAVWLTSVQTKAGDINFEGKALNMDAVANLMSQMLVSGYFRDVELKETAEQSNNGGEKLPQIPFKFTLIATPGATTAPPSAITPQAAAAKKS